MPGVERFDVAVIGGGTMGSAAAWALAKQGLRPVVLEQFSVVHDQGSHSGDTRIFRHAYAESPDYAPLVLRADELWQDLMAETGETVLNRCGGLELSAPGYVHASSAREAAAAGLKRGPGRVIMTLVVAALVIGLGIVAYMLWERAEKLKKDAEKMAKAVKASAGEVAQLKAEAEKQRKKDAGSPRGAATHRPKKEDPCARCLPDSSGGDAMSRWIRSVTMTKSRTVS